jgi:hypothetical protein
MRFTPPRTIFAEDKRKGFFIALSRRIVVFLSAVTRLQKRLALRTLLRKKRHLEVFCSLTHSLRPEGHLGKFIPRKTK